MNRVVSYIGLIFSIIFLPWWFTLFIAAIFLFYFNHYYELFIFGLFMDFLYAAPQAKYYGIVFISTALAIALIVAAELLKQRLRYYR